MPALHEIAWPAGRHQILHFARAAVGKRIKVVNGQDKPVFEMVQTVQVDFFERTFW